MTKLYETLDFSVGHRTASFISKWLSWSEHPARLVLRTRTGGICCSSTCLGIQTPLIAEITTSTFLHAAKGLAWSVWTPTRTTTLASSESQPWRNRLLLWLAPKRRWGGPARFSFWSLAFQSFPSLRRSWSW